MNKTSKKQIFVVFLVVIFTVLPLSAQMIVPSNSNKYGKQTPVNIDTVFNITEILLQQNQYKPLENCQDFANQKYIDITNYVAIASFYENYPVAGTYNLFKYLNEQQQVAPQEYRIGYAKTADISKKRSKNLFHEVIYHISKVAEHTGNGVKMPHIRNGLYLKYDNVPYLPGGVDVYNSSGTSTNKITEVFANSNTVCMCENPEETPLYSAPCTACNNISGATIHSIASYRQSFYTTFSGGGNSSPDLTIPENRFKIVQGLQDQLLRLLIQRANIEVTWQERKEEILSIHPEDADIYGVADIKQSSLELLRKLTPFREVGEIRRLEDITDGDILREYDNRSKEADENYYRNLAIKDARIKRFEELQAKLTDTVRTTRFTETEEAEKLWNQHFMNTRYYLDSFSNDMRGSTDQDVRKQWYPNGETEYLIETVLSQIDERIAKILLAVTGTTIGNMEVPDCIGTSSSNDDKLVCDYDPAWFMKAVGGIVSPGEMETSYKECVSITKNDPNAFQNSVNNNSSMWLGKVPNLWVFKPSEGWDEVGNILYAVAKDSINDSNTSDSELDSKLKTMEKILQDYQRWKKEYKKDDNTLNHDNIQTYFHFGDKLWEYYPKNEYDPSEGYEKRYCKTEENEGSYSEKCVVNKEGEGEDAVKTRYDSNTSLKSKFETCFGLQGGGRVTMNALSNSSNDDSKYWECFETWIDANTLYMEEVQAIQSRMAILESNYRLLKARIAARKLKKSGMLNPEISADGETNNDPNQVKNPFGIPSSLEKWYSNYMQFGVDDLNANFNFIAGLGIKNIVLDPNAYNPIEYLRNGEAFIAQLGKAMLKYADESGYENALNNNPHQVEIAALLLGHKMMLNLKNINKFSKMYEEVFSTIHQFDPDKIRALFSGRALKNLVDEEKVIEILAQELAFEIMTRMSLQNDGNAVPPYTVLQALMRGSNFWLNEHERIKQCNVSNKESCLGALQEIEEIRAEAESLVRAWEGTIQENANIIRNELKKLYGQQGAFYHLIDSMVHSGNPLKGLNSSSNTDANEILFDMLVDAALNRAVGQNITFNCENNPPITVNVSGQGADNLAKKLKNCFSLSVTIGNSTINFGNNISSGNIQLLMETVVDFKSLLKTAAPEIALDYILTTFKIDAKERDSIKGQIKPALNQVKNVYCLPKIDGNANLKCADNDSLNISNLIVSSGNSGVPLSLNTVLTRAVREIIGDNGTNSVTPNQITQLENIARKYTNDENLIKVIVPVTIVTAYMQKFINNQIINREAAISSVQNAIGGALSSSSNEIFQNLGLCNDQNSLSDPEKCSINTFMRSISTIGSNLKGDNAMPDLVNDTTGCVACDSIATTIKNILSDTTTGNLHDNLNLITQHDIPAFNLQSSDINFDPVINFGRVKGSFVDKFMRLAESSMATTYSYTPPTNQNGQNEQDITDISFWRGLIGQMIIPELTDGAKDEINNLLTALANFDENMSKEEPNSTNGIATQYENLKGVINPFTFSAVGYNTVETVATDISDILSDGDLFIRVIKRLTDEIGIISTFKELMNDFNGETGSAIEWLLAEIDPDNPESLDDLICGLAGLSENANTNCTFTDLSGKLSSENVNLSQLLATAIAMRVEEIFMHELLKIPYGEVCTHVYSGLHLFSFDADLFETTFYVTTRLQKDRYGRLIDLEHVNPKSKEAFARKYEGKVETFKPYTKYYFFAQNISFDDLAASAIEKGKEAMEGLVKKGVEAASDKIEEKLAKYADDVNDTDTFKENFAKDPKLEDLEFANIEKGGTVNFQIGPVPAYLSFGMVFRAGLRYGVDYNAAWFRGLTLGASAGPYLVVGAYLEAGIGFDYSWISFKIGVGGSIDVFEFYAPLKVQGLLKPAMDLNGLNMKFYLTTSLEPEIYLLAGKIYVKASGKIGIDPFAIGFSVKKTIFDWDPLIKKKFGNIIPLKPIELDLFSIGRGMKVLGNDVSTF